MIEEIRLTREEVRLSKESREDLRELIQQQTLRMERAAEHQGRELANIGVAMERVVEHLDDMGDQVRASTRAILQRLDRFEGSGGAATA